VKEFGIDKLFHLGILVNDKYLLQKNEVLSFTTGRPDKDAQIIPINFGGDFTISEMVENARKKQGDSKFFIYDPFNANCQMFVKAVLTSNGITPPLKFIDQSAEEIGRRLPGYVKPVSKFITDLGAIVNLFRQKLKI
jgi:hypothetical protein